MIIPQNRFINKIILTINIKIEKSAHKMMILNDFSYNLVKNIEKTKDLTKIKGIRKKHSYSRII